MLAYYTSLIKKEEIVRKLTEDATNLASLANDLVCEIKEFANACSDRDLENALASINEAEETSKVVSAMISNIKDNYNVYLSSIIGTTETKQVLTEQKESEPKQTKEENPDPNQLGSLLEAIKSLKEMKDSIG